MTINKTVKLLNGTEANCVHDIDEQGFILYAIHGNEGDVTRITEDEYDNVERQCVHTAPSPIWKTPQ